MVMDSEDVVITVRGKCRDRRRRLMLDAHAKIPSRRSRRRQQLFSNFSLLYGDRSTDYMVKIFGQSLT